ncbi:translation initiation factor IF-2 (chromatophore) [Paulinella micropora]|uniref:Translation initiation factor IF-2, chloroplastic n=1 Tax=Paulinella micropora TaxID=1928728 RepID=A0A1S6YH65_9EUKA|nr:translation initiation factor IF-2 [Paulinella micropora]BBL85852.1 translation initiation factor IF-2 [Paulinella micropora]
MTTSSGKIRIYELSRDLGLDNKDVLDVAEKLSIPVKSHSSSISNDEAAQIRELIESKKKNPGGGSSTVDKVTLPIQADSPILSKSPKKDSNQILRSLSEPVPPISRQSARPVQNPPKSKIHSSNHSVTSESQLLSAPTKVIIDKLNTFTSSSEVSTQPDSGTSESNLPVTRFTSPSLTPMTSELNPLTLQSEEFQKLEALREESIKRTSLASKPVVPVARPKPIPVKPSMDKSSELIPHTNDNHDNEISLNESNKLKNNKLTAPTLRPKTTVKNSDKLSISSPRPSTPSKRESVKSTTKPIALPSKPTAPVLRSTANISKSLSNRPEIIQNRSIKAKKDQSSSSISEVESLKKKEVLPQSPPKSAVTKLTPPAPRPNALDKPEIVQKPPIKLATPVSRPSTISPPLHKQKLPKGPENNTRSTLGNIPIRRPVAPPPQRVSIPSNKANPTGINKPQLVTRPQSSRSGTSNSKVNSNIPPISRVPQSKSHSKPPSDIPLTGDKRSQVNTLELVGKPIRRDSGTSVKRFPIETPKRQGNTGQGPRKPMAHGDLIQLNKPGSRPIAPPPRRADGSIAGTDNNALESKPIPPGPRPTAIPPTPPRRPGFRNSAPSGGTRRPNRPDWDDSAKLEALRSKTPQKQRQKVHIIGENDDPLTTQTSGYAGGQDAVILQASLARPSKPKNQQQDVETKPVVVFHKRKKETTRQRQRRRAMELRASREAKQVRPDMLIVPEGNLTVQELADKLGTESSEIIKSLFFKGIIATVTQTLDLAMIETVSEEFGVPVLEDDIEEAAKKTVEMIEESDFEHLIRRPPVVTVMGHVDHGKTSLLDAIRKTRVAAGEAGGITQHIGAYQVEVPHGIQQRKITFLDTPGHEAFTAMRARGTKVTDVAVLVVAADDGVRPQTLEAISHARAAEVPIIVAINKIDKEGAQPDRVKQELSDQNLLAEEWGGETVMVPVSAIRGENIDQLLEMILLVSEVEDLQANPNRMAKGTVIEAHLDKAKGPVATLLVQNGTLRAGDVVAAGPILGKVRAMMDYSGKRVKEAGPSFAVEALGFSEVPTAGDEFEVYLDEKAARAVVGERANEARATRLAQQMASRRVSLATISGQASEGELKELNLILKADVQGSVEAILGSLEQLPKDEVQVRVLLSAPGEITETDVDLAAASGAVIIGFNTSMASGAKRAADTNGVDVREYSVIYKLLEDIQMAMEGLLEPELVEESLGEAEVRAVFSIGKSAVAGCYVLDGKVQRNTKIRVRRGKQLIFEGDLNSLRRNKDDIKEVATGFECGIGCDRFANWEEGDRIEVYKMVTQRRTLSI